MQTDPIADFLTRLRNAAAAKHQRVDVPVSRLKTEIARILKEEGYISTYKLVEESKTRKMLRVFLKRSEEHTSELQSPCNLVCRLLLEKKKKQFVTAI